MSNKVLPKPHIAAQRKARSVAARQREASALAALFGRAVQRSLDSDSATRLPDGDIPFTRVEREDAA